MTQKERLEAKQRLVELFETSPSIVGSATWREYYEQTADHFLANGVIVPPCKVGDTVYITQKLSMVPIMTHVANMFFDGQEFQYNADDEVFCDFSESDFGHEVFFTYKDAEQALKERKQ